MEYSVIRETFSLHYAISGIYQKTRPVIRDGYIVMYAYAPFEEQSIAATRGTCHVKNRRRAPNYGRCNSAVPSGVLL